ncbi:hypothetical protein B0T09DRAFT_68503 [Sordaria sp. MPI-SDFR-AT-0083]|nr:hypothetical protein B0T09DRAFT_68503 [Sordaria sp. MPI-SDFR-AT-0083]
MPIHNHGRPRTSGCDYLRRFGKQHRYSTTLLTFTRSRKHETRPHSESQELNNHCQVCDTVARIPLQNCHATSYGSFETNLPSIEYERHDQPVPASRIPRGPLGRLYPWLLFQALVAPLDPLGTEDGLSKLKEGMTAIAEHRLQHPAVCRTCVWVQLISCFTWMQKLPSRAKTYATLARPWLCFRGPYLPSGRQEKYTYSCSHRPRNYKVQCDP